MSSVELFAFERHQIRTVAIDGRKLAVAADICAALGIDNPTKAMARLDVDDKVVIRRSDTLTSNQGIWEAFAPQVQSIGLVTEDGATDLVLESRKPEARRFRRFLTHEVWPSIRDTGSYSTASALTEDEIVHAALAITARRVEELTERVAELEPKAEFYDDLMDSEGKYSFLAAAKALGWGRNVMLRELRRMGVLTGGNLPYQRYSHHFKVVPQTYVNGKTGETIATATTYVLPSGLDFLRKKLNKSLVTV